MAGMYPLMVAGGGDLAQAVRVVRSAQAFRAKPAVGIVTRSQAGGFALALHLYPHTASVHNRALVEPHLVRRIRMEER